MATPQGLVRVRREAASIAVQVEGWGRMAQSLPLRRYVEQASAAGVNAVFVDLRRCTYVDSTFLGTLLYLRRYLLKRGGDLELIAPSPECAKLFHQLGVHDAFHTRAAEASAGPWSELCRDIDDVNAFNRNVIEAHQELANLSGTAGATFKAVSRCLAKDGPAGDKR